MTKKKSIIILVLLISIFSGYLIIKSDGYDYKVMIDNYEKKEVFTTMDDIIDKYGDNFTKKDILDKNNIYNHGYYSILDFNGIEFTFNCSGDSEDPFTILKTDRACRIDINSSNHKLKIGMHEIKVGDSISTIEKLYNVKMINPLDENDNMNASSLMKSIGRNMDHSASQKAFYFEDKFEDTVLGVLLIIDNGCISNIIIGMPTWG